MISTNSNNIKYKSFNSSTGNILKVAGDIDYEGDYVDEFSQISLSVKATDHRGMFLIGNIAVHITDVEDPPVIKATINPEFTCPEKPKREFYFFVEHLVAAVSI